MKIKFRKIFKNIFKGVNNIRIFPLVILVFILVFVFGNVLKSLISASGVPWVQTDWSGGVGGSTSTQFSSSSNIDYGTNGEIKLNGTAGWYNSSWNSRKKITFNNTAANIGTTSENLINYPVLVKLTSSNFDFTKAKSDGSDIRFTDSDGTTLLSYEIEKWDSVNQLASVWVKVPQINIESNTDNIYMYFGNSGATDAQTASSVWDSNFVGVWHLKEDPSGPSNPMKDSTSYANNGYTVGSMTTGDVVNGQLGTAIDFDGNDAIVVNDHASLSGMNYLTQEAWVYMRSFAGGPVVMGKNNSYDLYMVGGGTLLTDYKAASGGAVPLNQWAQIVMTYNGSNARLYINGALIATGGATSGAITISNTPFEIGRWASVTEYVNGLIDESRVSTVARSAAWIAVSYKQGTDNFNTYLSTENYYVTSGTLTSNIYDTSSGSDFGLLTYTATTPAGSSVSVKVRAGNQANLSDASNFNVCAATASGVDLSGGCSPDNKRYVQYEVTLTGNGLVTPTFSDITINNSPSDVTPPNTNASSVIMYRTNGGTTVNSEEWISSLSPKFSWTAGADETGIKGYCLRLVNKSSLAPNFDDTSPTDLTNITFNSSGLVSSANTPVVTTGTDCSFIINSTEIDFSNQSYRQAPWLTTSSDLYYLFIKVIDVGNNMYTGPSTFFKFKFDSTVPTNVSYISSASGTFGNVNDMNFSWPVAGGTASSDNDSGLLGWQYQINSSSGTWQGTSTSASLGVNYIPSNYSSFPYFLNAGIDGPNVQIGNNVIYFRTIDIAGNVSSPATLRTANISFGGAAPTFPGSCDNTTGITITPTTSTSNSFSLSWPAATPAPGRTISKYYYMVNTQPPSTLATITSNTATYVESSSTTVASAPLSAVVKGSNSVYVVAVDDINIYSSTNCLKGTFTLNSTLPDSPLNLSVADTSIKSASIWRASLAWNIPVYKGTGILSYKVDRSEDGSTWVNIGTTSGTAFLDTVSESKRYYWRVSTMDNTIESQNAPSASNAVTLIPKGVYTEAPTLTSSPQALDISTKKAKISWTTSREADSKIAFGTSSGQYFNEEVYSSTKETNHLIFLSNLTPATLYYYVARWTDEDGNTGTSPELSFRTLEAPRVKDVSVTNISISSALIKYTSKGASSVKIYYGKSTDFGGVKEIPTSPVEAPYTSQLTGLDDGTKYYYKINSLDADGNEYQGTVLDLTTLPRPRLFDINFSQIRGTAQPSVLVSWNSNTEVSTVVSYYEASNSKAVKDETNPNLIKGVNRAILRNLNPETNYAMVIKARDKVGNEVVSDVYQFTTAIDTRPPTISGMKVESVVPAKSGQSTGAQIIVSWNTDKPATSQVEFGEGTGGNYSQKTQEETTLKQNHLVVISDLTPSKVYSIRALSRDKAGNIGKSSGNNTLTPKAVDSALDIVITILSDAFSFLSGINKK
jgi:hypothetical protein